MHPFDIMIVVSIACCVGFTPALYVKKDVTLAIGYFVGSAIGAVGGSYAAFRFFPHFDKPGILVGGFLGAVLLVIGWRIVRKNAA